MPYKDPQKAREYSRRASRRWREAHPEQARANVAKWRAANLEQARASDREAQAKKRAQQPPGARAAEQRLWRSTHDPRKKKSWNLKKMYGITIDEYDAILAAQGGVCAVCGSAGRFHVDHDHATGMVRAILCGLCNLTIGHAHEEPDRLRRCAEYLERHGRKLRVA